MFILVFTNNICVKKHIFKSRNDDISVKSTIFAADFLPSNADFQHKSNVPGGDHCKRTVPDSIN